MYPTQLGMLQGSKAFHFLQEEVICAWKWTLGVLMPPAPACLPWSPRCSERFANCVFPSHFVCGFFPSWRIHERSTKFQDVSRPDEVQREIYRPPRSVWCRGAAETARILIYKCETSRPSLPAVISSCVKEVVKQARSKNCVSLNLEFIAVLNSLPPVMVSAVSVVRNLWRKAV